MSDSALSNRNFLIYLSGNTISLHGLWVYRLAQGWLAWQLTGSEFWVGVVAFTQYFPSVLFGPLFGVLADRFDRKAALLLIHSISTVNMVLLTVLTGFGKVDIYVLCLLSLVQGISDSALTPTRLALIPNLVPRHQLQNAVALNSVSFNVSRFIGPALAGIMIAYVGISMAFAFNAISYVAVISALLMVNLAPSGLAAPRRSDVWEEMKEGIAYAIAHPSIRVVLVIITVSSILARGPLELLPAFSDLVFNRGSGALAILTSAAGGGAIISGLLLSQRMRRVKIEAIATGVTIVGVLVVLLGLVKEFWFAAGIVAALGFSLSYVGVGSQILLQNDADERYRGRVSSFWALITFGGTALGGLLVGGFSSLWGLTMTTVSSGACCAVLALWIILRLRSYE